MLFRSLGEIKDIEIVRSSGLNRIVVEIDGDEVDVPEDMIFVVGKEEPAITVVE